MDSPLLFSPLGRAPGRGTSFDGPLRPPRPDYSSSALRTLCERLSARPVVTRRTRSKRNAIKVVDDQRRPHPMPTNERKVIMTGVQNVVLVDGAERVAVLGTGIMGAPMARNLLKAGFQVRVWNRTPDKARVLAAEGADLAETPADAVREAAFVITMLTDTAAVLAVMRQAAESVPDGAVWLQTSMDTDVECVAELAEAHGITFVDCPVLGTRETATQGRLVVLASGTGDPLDGAQPSSAAIGSKTVRLEPEAGRSSRMKLVA